MSVADVLDASRIAVCGSGDGSVHNKATALERLSRLLGAGQTSVDIDDILQSLHEREKLQSTGVGGGVAVPHGSIENLQSQLGALLLCAPPIDFDAIDGQPVSIFFALVGPQGAAAAHLKILAQVSRLFHKKHFRHSLVGTKTATQAYDLIVSAERDGM